MSQARRKDFEESLAAFVTDLTARKGGRAVRVSTPLFAAGLLDSLKILDLICFVEAALGIRIPDHRVTLGNFKSIKAISDAFCKRQRDGGKG
jgi:acyl carrier protein